MSANGNRSEAERTFNEVEVVIRSQEPTKYKDLAFKLAVNTSVLKLKTLISEKHPRKPPPNDQVLICGGRVLKDGNSKLHEILRPLEEGPYNFHLVLKSKEPIRESTSAPNLTRVQQQPQQQPVQNNQVVALPYMMVNPVVSAAYSAAIAAVYNPAEGTASNQFPGPFPTVHPPTAVRDQSQSSSNTPTPSIQPSPPPGPNQMVPAIAFFPLGIPVMVPATAQNQGFQIGQQHFHPQSSAMSVQQPVQIRRQGPVVGRPQGGGMGGGNVPAAPGRIRRRRVIVCRLSFGSILRFIIILTFLFVTFSREKFFLSLLAIGGMYLLVRPMRRLLRRFHLQRDGNGGGEPRGILNEIFTFVLSFISSVFLNWDAELGNLGGDPESPRRQVPEAEPHPHAE